MDSPIRIAIVEDREATRQGLRYLIDASEGYRCAADFSNAEAFLQRIPGLEVDVVLMDIGLPGLSGIEATRRLKDCKPGVQVMILTVYEDDERLFQSLQAGATGYILKKTPPGQLMEAIRELHRGGSPMSGSIARRVVASFQQPCKVRQALTAREREILEHVVQGYRFREIAELLHISLETVRSHIRNIYEKLHVRSRTEAAVKYLGG
jgi:DNA-binding NarL/FixJ family response regulator